jgi:hypothetical protein
MIFSSGAELDMAHNFFYDSNTFTITDQRAEPNTAFNLPLFYGFGLCTPLLEMLLATTRSNRKLQLDFRFTKSLECIKTSTRS